MKVRIFRICLDNDGSFLCSHREENSESRGAYSRRKSVVIIDAELLFKSANDKSSLVTDNTAISTSFSPQRPSAIDFLCVVGGYNYGPCLNFLYLVQLFLHRFYPLLSFWPLQCLFCRWKIISNS